MGGFAQSIYIPIEIARPVRALVFILHLIAFSVPLLVSAWSPATAIVLSAVLVSLWLTLSDYRAVDRDLRSILLRPNGEWIVSTRESPAMPAALVSAPFVSIPLIIIELLAVDGRRWHLTLTGANTEPATLRRLRVRLSLPQPGEPPVET